MNRPDVLLCGRSNRRGLRARPFVVELVSGPLPSFVVRKFEQAVGRIVPDTAGPCFPQCIAERGAHSGAPRRCAEPARQLIVEAEPAIALAHPETHTAERRPRLPEAYQSETVPEHIRKKPLPKQ